MTFDSVLTATPATPVRDTSCSSFVPDTVQARNDSTSSSVVPETQHDDRSVNMTQDCGDTSEDDMSSLLLPQDPQETDTSTVTCERIPCVVTDRSSAPVNLSDCRQIQLFRGPKEPLSAFYHHPLRWRNRTYISAEQAYQHAKLVHHKAPVMSQRDMLRCRSSHACKQLAYKCVKVSNASWDSVKYELMKEICIVKFRQCSKFKEALLKSGDAFLLHNTETDPTWGCGPDLKGLNKMGHILMTVRQQALDYQQEFPPLPQTDTKTVVPEVSAEEAPVARKIVVIGNSNARGLSQRLHKNDVSCSGFVYPGQTAARITQHVKNINLRTEAPDAILLHVGDVEIRDFSLPVTSVTNGIRSLIGSVRSKCADTPIIISGLPHAPGSRSLNNRIAHVNAVTSHLCHRMKNVRFISNKTASLAQDRIHLTAHAKDSLCNNISYLVKQCI